MALTPADLPSTLRVIVVGLALLWGAWLVPAIPCLAGTVFATSLSFFDTVRFQRWQYCPDWLRSLGARGNARHSPDLRMDIVACACRRVAGPCPGPQAAVHAPYRVDRSQVLAECVGFVVRRRLCCAGVLWRCVAKPDSGFVLSSGGDPASNRAGDSASTRVVLCVRAAPNVLEHHCGDLAPSPLVIFTVVGH